jgi:cysteinyl-tRNA synthetase
MNDDFNTPSAIAALFEHEPRVNAWLNSGEALTKEALEALEACYNRLMGDVLGLLPEGLDDEDGREPAGRESDRATDTDAEQALREQRKLCGRRCHSRPPRRAGGAASGWP